MPDIDSNEIQALFSRNDMVGSFVSNFQYTLYGIYYNVTNILYITLRDCRETCPDVDSPGFVADFRRRSRRVARGPSAPRANVAPVRGTRERKPSAWARRGRDGS